MDPKTLAAFILEQLREVHCDLADAPKAQAAVGMLECIASGAFVLVTAVPQQVNPRPPAGALA